MDIEGFRGNSVRRRSAQAAKTLPGRLLRLAQRGRGSQIGTGMSYLEPIGLDGTFDALMRTIGGIVSVILFRLSLIGEDGSRFLIEHNDDTYSARAIVIRLTNCHQPIRVLDSK